MSKYSVPTNDFIMFYMDVKKKFSRSHEYEEADNSRDYDTIVEAFYKFMMKEISELNERDAAEFTEFLLYQGFDRLVRISIQSSKFQGEPI